MKKINTHAIFTLLLMLGVGILNAQVSFTNQSAILGTVNGFSYQDCAVDMNGDYLDDVVRVKGNGLTIHYQQADGSFTQQEWTINWTYNPDWSICAGDLDGNGFNDLLFGNGSGVSFVKANEDGTQYTETPMTDYIFSQRSTMADINNDGHLDAFVCHDVDQSIPYLNDGFGNMIEDQTLIQTADYHGNYAAIWVDYDNDWDNDLYITKCVLGSSPGDIERTNLLYRNNGDGTYTEVGEQANMDDNAQGWATVFEDFDNDGDFDAFIVNHDSQNRFMINNGDGTFTDMIDITGIPANDLGAWENAAGDFNNDGFVDIFSELNNAIYLNNGDLTFSPVDQPFDDGGIGDFNNDGFLDVIDGGSLWLNDANDNNWVKINTRGIFSNRNGIGARVEIYGDWGVQIREVRSGQSFSPMSSLTVHFGLGASTEMDSIVVKWPSGFKSVVENPEINITHFIPEADCIGADFQVEIDGETQLCAGESTTFIAPVGVSYLWSNGETTQSITVESAGNYSVILTDADGCAAFSDAVPVTMVEDVAPLVNASDEAFCKGGSVLLTAEAQTTDLLWSNGVSMQSQIMVSEPGEYFVEGPGICSDEPLTSNIITLTMLDAPEPEVEGITILAGNMALLEASGDSLLWYETDMSVNPIFTGANFETPILTESTTYFVENLKVYGGEVQSGGKLDASGNGGLPATGAYSLFNAWEPFTILTVDVSVPFSAPAGDRTIQLVNGQEEILAETVIYLTQGQTEVTLDFEVPVGENLSLRCPENNLFRNIDNLNYPYAIGDVGEITTSLFGDLYYYYFYNWQIQTDGYSCVSERVPVEVFVTSTDDFELNAAFDVFPNPVETELFVTFEATETENVDLELTDVTGKVLSFKTFKNISLGSNQFQLKWKNLPTGMYFLKIHQGEKVGFEKVLVK